MIRSFGPRRGLCLSALLAIFLLAPHGVAWAESERSSARSSARSSGSVASTGAAAPPAGVAEAVLRQASVIMISLDGTRPRDLNEEDAPSLVALAQRGLQADGLIPAIPTNTFPNHVTLVTGVAPERHGIVNNTFVDPERGMFRKRDIPSWVQVEPLWSLLARQGVVSASYYWVGSEGPWPGGGGPLHWKPFSSRTGEWEKVEQILAWLDIEDPARRPRFITSWFHGADHAAHLNGPGHVEARRALRSQEPAIAALIAGLEERGLFDSTTLIFVSDHGMASVDDRVLVGEALREAGIAAFTTGIGGFASVYLEDSSDAEIARAIALIEGLGLAAVDRTHAPASLRVANPRFGDIVLGASPGTAISHEGLNLAGFHGYHPDEPEMLGLFVAAGRGALPGSRLGRVRSIDVAPTVLSLLGLPVPDWMEGRPIAALGVAATEPGALATGRAGLQDSAPHARQAGGVKRAVSPASGNRTTEAER